MSVLIRHPSDSNKLLTVGGASLAGGTACCCVACSGCVNGSGGIICRDLMLVNVAYEIEITGETAHGHFAALNGTYEVDIGYNLAPSCSCKFGVDGCIWGAPFEIGGNTYKIGFRVCCGTKSGNCCVAIQGEAHRTPLVSEFARIWRKTDDCIVAAGTETPHLNDFLPVTLDLSLGSGFSNCSADDFNTDLGGQMEIRVVT